METITARKASYSTKLLDQSTFDDFARMVEKNHIWGGCWCLGFHGTETSREAKERRVREGTTHAALVYAGSEAVGWCQFGRTDELPRIKHRAEYEKTVRERPDWRITCFVVDREHRRRGVAARALQAALEEIARQGGGLVESYPEDVTDRKTSSAFLYNATVSMFERQGFIRTGRLGKNHWVVTKLI